MQNIPLSVIHPVFFLFPSSPFTTFARLAFLSFASALRRLFFFRDVHLLVYPCVTETRSSASSRCRVA
jgi:hypothetical protein